MQVSASSLPASPPNEIRTSPPIARSALIWEATGSLPTAVTPPHSGVQPPLPPATTKARLNCLTPVACAVVTRLNGGYKLVSTYGANPALPADGELDVLGDGEALAVGDAGAGADALGAAVALAVAAGLVWRASAARLAGHAVDRAVSGGAGLARGTGHEADRHRAARL